MSMARRWDEVRVAMMLLTRLPVGQLPDPVPSMAEARWAYPVGGVVVGAITGVIITIAVGLGASPVVAAILGVVSGLVLTGALHEDGLADLADGLGGRGDAARKLEIMRDSRIGSFGVLALIIAVALKVTALADLAATGQVLASCIAMAAVSRGAMSLALGIMPPARRDGLGQLAASDPAMSGKGLTLAVMLLAAVPLGVTAPFATVVALIAAALMALWIAGLAQRQIGGQTGDVLGAMQLGAEGAGLVVLSMLL